nr:glycosyltransferase family 4 protein [Noviherbaspirillum autotrophicum]
MYPSRRDKTYGRFVQRCAESLVAAGIETDIVSLPKHHNYLFKLLDYVRFAIQANVKILKRGYDCVYVHQPLHSLLVCIPALMLRRVRLVLNFHGHDLVPVTRRGEFLQKILSRLFMAAKIVVVPSEHFKQIFDNEFGNGRSEGARVFYSGGVHDDYFASKLIVASSRPRSALFLSRLVEGKGWRLFIELAQKLRAVYPDFNFTIAGVGPDRQIIESAIAEANLSDCTQFVSATTVSQNRDLFLSHRYFVFPTWFNESLALVNLEAMACGCVVLSADFPTASEYIEQAVNGFRIPIANFVETSLFHICELENDIAFVDAISNDARTMAYRFKESDVMKNLPSTLGLKD